MANTADSEIQCANPDCRIAETGKCVEGLTRETCPHFGRASEAQAAEDGEGVPESASSGITLPAADRLSTSDAAKILRAQDARIVAIIGPTDAGKTSLIAGLYDLFQRGPVDGTYFAGSATLHAFERACHDARAASGRSEPYTERTGRGGVTFYHLNLANVTAPPLALILGDRAGEEYRSAADNVSSAAGFAEVLRADSISILMDGRRLLDLGARHNLRSEIELMVQALVDGGAIQRRLPVALVLTKLDEVQASPHRARAIADFENLLDSLRQHYGHVFVTIEPFQIAASPKTTDLPRGHGVDRLLAFWIAATAAPMIDAAEPHSVPDRAFARIDMVHDE